MLQYWVKHFAAFIVPSQTGISRSFACVPFVSLSHSVPVRLARPRPGRCLCVLSVAAVRAGPFILACHALRRCDVQGGSTLTLAGVKYRWNVVC